MVPAWMASTGMRANLTPAYGGPRRGASSTTPSSSRTAPRSTWSRSASSTRPAASSTRSAPSSTRTGDPVGAPQRARPAPSPADRAWRSRERIREDLLAFLTGPGEEIELWAWFGAYDHVALCQLWGAMPALPRPIPRFTRELRQRWDDLGQPALPPKPAGTQTPWSTPATTSSAGMRWRPPGVTAARPPWRWSSGSDQAAGRRRPQPRRGTPPPGPRLRRRSADGLVLPGRRGAAARLRRDVRAVRRAVPGRRAGRRGPGGPAAVAMWQWPGRPQDARPEQLPTFGGLLTSLMGTERAARSPGDGVLGELRPPEPDAYLHRRGRPRPPWAVPADGCSTSPSPPPVPRVSSRALHTTTTANCAASTSPHGMSPRTSAVRRGLARRCWSLATRLSGVQRGPPGSGSPARPAAPRRR